MIPIGFRAVLCTMNSIAKIARIEQNLNLRLQDKFDKIYRFP